jgi:hypothetical protein
MATVGTLEDTARELSIGSDLEDGAPTCPENAEKVDARSRRASATASSVDMSFASFTMRSRPRRSSVLRSDIGTSRSSMSGPSLSSQYGGAVEKPDEEWWL